MSFSENPGTELVLSEVGNPTFMEAKLRRHFPGLEVESRCRFRLAPSLIPSLHTNVKETTIRYSRNAVEYPVASDLPAYEDLSGTDGDLRPIGHLKIAALNYKTFGSLTEEDATRDGFRSAADLRSALCEYYGEIGDTEIVSIYAIHFDAGSVEQSHSASRLG